MKFLKVAVTDPPKPLSNEAIILGKIAAVVSAAFAIIQLLDLSKAINNLSYQFSGSDSWATAVVVLVLLAEILALPFLLRYRMSNLARVCSGILAVVGPWIWTLITIWSLGLENATAAQFGPLSIASSWLVLAVNVAWMAFILYVVKKLGIEKTWQKLAKGDGDLKKSSK